VENAHRFIWYAFISRFGLVKRMKPCVVIIIAPIMGYVCGMRRFPMVMPVIRYVNPFILISFFIFSFCRIVSTSSI